MKNRSVPGVAAALLTGLIAAVGCGSAGAPDSSATKVGVERIESVPPPAVKTATPVAKVAEEPEGRGLIPLPTLVEGKGTMQLPATMGIAIGSSAREIEGDHVAQWMAEIGVKTTRIDTREAPAGAFTLGSSSSMEKESYKLDVTADKVVVVGGSPTGLFWGLQTLRQLLIPPKAGSTPAAGMSGYAFPIIHIEDAPRFAVRTVMLDVSRHFFPAPYIKHLIELISRYKFNTFQWHLTDDNGWRIPIDKYPRLTSVGAWRENTGDEPFGLPKGLHKPMPAGTPPYGGFYTKEEIRDIVLFATRHRVTIIPEIDLPGHSMAALAAYPELSCTAKAKYEVAPGTVPVFSDPLCPCKPKVFDFVRAVLKETAELFPGPWLHIGGDEVNPKSWLTSDVCKTFMRKNKMTTAKDLSTHFAKETAAMVRDLGRRAMAWDEAVENDPPAWMDIVAWRGPPQTLQSARAGKRTVVIDQLNGLYFGNSRGPRFGAASRPYEFDAVPKELDAEEAKNIIGVGGALWTEGSQTTVDIERHILPMLLAVAETGWTRPDKKNWDRFALRLVPHMRKLVEQGFTLFLPPPEGLPERTVFEQPMKIELRPPVPGAEIRYTLDGSEPQETSSLYGEPLTIDHTTEIKARAFLAGVGSSGVAGTSLVKADPVPATAGLTVEPGLCMKLHDGAAQGMRQVPQLPVLATGTIPLVALPDRHPPDDFGLVLSGFIAAPKTGMYNFCTTSNDGSIMKIDGQTVVDNGGKHSTQQRCGKVVLQTGQHPVEVVFIETRGGEHLEAHWAPPGEELVSLPAAALSHAAATDCAQK